MAVKKSKTPEGDRPTLQKVYYSTPNLEKRVNQAFIQQVTADPNNNSKTRLIRELIDAGLKARKL